MKGVVLYYGHDPIAVKVFGMLKDAGYYAHLNLDVIFGYTLTVCIKPKNVLLNCFIGHDSSPLLPNNIL